MSQLNFSQAYFIQKMSIIHGGVFFFIINFFCRELKNICNASNVLNYVIKKKFIFTIPPNSGQKYKPETVT